MRSSVPDQDIFPVQRIVLYTEEIHHEGGPAPAAPLLRGAALAVVKNPFAGRYVQDIAESMDALKPLGKELAGRLAAALGGPARIQGYGKGAIVGSDGELEHGALWHVPGGYAMRETLDDSLAIVPSTKKVGGPGARLDVPLTHKDASYVRSHFDAIEVGVPGAPARDEIVFVLAMSTGPRVHARVGGLEADQITERNGLR
jgi:Amino acid synthesis